MSYHARFFHLLFSLSETEYRQFKRNLITLNKNRQKKSRAILNLTWQFLSPYQAKKELPTSEEITQFKIGLYQKIYKRAYNNRQLNTYYNTLSRLLEEFMMMQQIRSSKLLQKELMLQVAAARGIDQEYFNNITHIKNLNNKNPLRNSTYFHRQYQLTYAAYFHPDVPKHQDQTILLNQIYQYLNQFIFTTRLRLACELQSRAFLFGELHQQDTLEKLMRQCIDNQYYQSTAIKIFTLILRLYQDHAFDVFFEAKSMLRKHYAIFNYEEQNTIIILLYNYLCRFLNGVKRTEILTEIYELLRFAFEKEIFGKPNHYIETNLFIGMFQIACETNVDWATEILLKYPRIIPQPRQHQVHQLCKGILQFYHQNYKDAIFILNQLELADYTHLIRSKAFILMANYELRHERPITNILQYANNFLRQLNQQNILQADIREATINFVKFFRKLLHKKSNLIALKQQIMDCLNLARRAWLLKKVKELLPKPKEP